jgi:hypothetical protein
MIKFLKSSAAVGARAVMTLVVASMLGSLYVAPAFAERDNNHARQDNRHGDQGRRQWSGNRENYPYRPVYRRPYSYAQPVYVPPPMYYEPRQSPGVSFFFPLDLRHR